MSNTDLSTAQAKVLADLLFGWAHNLTMYNDSDKQLSEYTEEGKEAKRVVSNLFYKTQELLGAIYALQDHRGAPIYLESVQKEVRG